MFWELDPKSLEPFSKAFELRLKMQDSQNHQLGAYVRLAIVSAMDKKAKYPERPFSSTAKRGREMSAEEIKEKMMRTMKQVNRRLGKES